MINVFQPELGFEELEAVFRVFKSNWIGRGVQTEEFETAFALYKGIEPEEIASTTCATEGLFSLAELYWRPGDEVIVPTISFIAAATSVRHVGAVPIFCDVSSITLNVTVPDIKKVLTKRTRGIIINHYGGLPVEQEVFDFCRDMNLIIIEDAACAIGSPVGMLGDAGVWSFDSMKILVTGDGGMIYVKDPEDMEKLRKKLYLGLETKSGLASTKDRWWEYDIACDGRRAIMNDLTASIGLIQLGKLNLFLKRRKQISEMYHHGLKDLGMILCPEVERTHYLYWIQLPMYVASSFSRDALAMYLRKHEIYTTFRYYPLHLVKNFNSLAVLPCSEYAAKCTLNIPLHHSLTDEEVEYIISTIRRYFHEEGNTD